MSELPEKKIPQISEADLETINAILRKGVSVEIRRRKDSVVILAVKAKVSKEIRNERD